MVTIFMLCGLSLGQDAPIHGYRFGHFENISDPERSAANIRLHLEMAQQQEVPLEAYLHRGEHQAAWFAEHDPQVIEALRDSERVSLAYHPHDIRPFSDLNAEVKTLAWDKAVLRFHQLETCAIDFTTAALDCSEKGGVAALTDIVGRAVTAVAYNGVDAVSTYVHRHMLGIPVRGDSKSPMATFDGPPVELYWHMGALVISLESSARLGNFVSEEAVVALRSMQGPEPRMFSLIASDKAEQLGANEQLSERYRPGISTLESIRLQPDEWYPARKIERYWSQQKDALRAASRRLVNATGGRWLTSSDLIERLVSPSEDLTQTDLSTGAALVTDRLGSVEVDLGARRISHADLFEGLRDALLEWRSDGVLPASVTSEGILGPIGEPLQGDWAVGGLEERRPVAVGIFLDALASQPLDRVPYALVVEEGQDAFSPVEQLAALASSYRAIQAGGSPPPIERLSAAPWPVPDGVRGGQRKNLSRGEWYTRLQFWTTKRARWK